MHQYMKRTTMLIFVVLLLDALCASAFAAYEMPDITKTDCSITLSFFDKKGIPIQGGSFTLYRIASVKMDGYVMSYDISGTAFEQSGVFIDDLDDTKLAQQLSVYAEKNKLAGTQKPIDKNGELSFENLPVGLYLIVQTESIPGYYSINPFFITVPAIDENSGVWIYHINGSPKGEPIPHIPPNTPPPAEPPTNPPADTISLTVQKVWTDNGKTRPESISVQLLRGDVVYEEIILGEKNNWSFTWSELDGAYAWRVQEVNIPKGYSASYRISGTEIVITNTSALIQTGQLNWPIPLLAELGVVLFVSGWFLTFVIKEKKQK